MQNAAVSFRAASLAQNEWDLAYQYYELERVVNNAHFKQGKTPETPRTQTNFQNFPVSE